MTLRNESWSQDVDWLIDFAIGRPYHWNMVALWAVVAVLAIVIAVALLFTPLFSNDRDIIPTLVASLVGIYALVEFVAGYLYFKRLKQRYQG